MARKSKRRYNPFDDVLFWFRLASINWSFGFNKSPKEGSFKEGKNGMNNNSPNLKHIEQETE